MWDSVELTLTGKVAVEGVRRSERTAAVAALFGVEIDAEREEVLFEDVRLTVGPGTVVLITGPSGAGKSTLLRAITEALRGRGHLRCALLEEIEAAGDRAVVDCFSAGLPETLGHLARAGLSEARLCLRSPAQLSEGQRFRYRLAQFFASEAKVLIADEFGATLDRVTARVVAHQLGKFVRATGRCAIVATTHEDLAEDLRPSVRVWKGFGNRITVKSGNDEAKSNDEARMTNQI